MLILEGAFSYMQARSESQVLRRNCWRRVRVFDSRQSVASSIHSVQPLENCAARMAPCAHAMCDKIITIILKAHSHRARLRPSTSVARVDVRRRARCERAGLWACVPYRRSRASTSVDERLHVSTSVDGRRRAWVWMGLDRKRARRAIAPTETHVPGIDRRRSHTQSWK